MLRIQKMKDSSMMSDKYRNASFEKYYVRKENEKRLRLQKNMHLNLKRCKKTEIRKREKKTWDLFFMGM